MKDFMPEKNSQLAEKLEIMHYISFIFVFTTMTGTSAE